MGKHKTSCTNTLETDNEERAMFLHLTARFLYAPVPICY